MTDEEVDLSRQTQIYTDAHGDPVGDCWRTALACLVRVPRDEVPHFADLYRDDESLAWWNASVLWVEDTVPGWTLICLNPGFPVYEDEDNCPDEVILSGGSPRGDWLHSVVGDSRTGELLWDPFPGKGGITETREVFAVTRIANYASVD